MNLQESIRKVLREDDYSPAGKEITPNKIVIHKSNPMFRDKIMEQGLKVRAGECYKVYVGYGVKCKPAIFATNSTNKRAWFDSTYDDDIWEINTEMIPDVKWYKDRHFESTKKHIVTFQDIPKEAITLKYEGTGSGDVKKWDKDSPNLYESIRRILREEVTEDKNLYGEKLKPCSTKPMTGYYRDGYCRTGDDDTGSHTVCARVTEEFLEFTNSKGNNLDMLEPGDKWCLCAKRWEEANNEGVAPKMIKSSTNIKTFDIIDNDEQELDEYTRTLKNARRQGVGLRFPKSTVKTNPQRFRKYTRDTINESMFFARRIDINDVDYILPINADQVYNETESYEQFKYELTLRAVEALMWNDYELGWEDLPEQEEIEFVTYVSNKLDKKIKSLYNIYHNKS
jgi:uncharacterized protein (DUF2237 family)